MICGFTAYHPVLKSTTPVQELDYLSNAASVNQQLGLGEIAWNAAIRCAGASKPYYDFAAECDLNRVDAIAPLRAQHSGAANLQPSTAQLLLRWPLSLDSASRSSTRSLERSTSRSDVCPAGRGWCPPIVGSPRTDYSVANNRHKILDHSRALPVCIWIWKSLGRRTTVAGWRMAPGQAVFFPDTAFGIYFADFADNMEGSSEDGSC